jgi:hypothetical protein
MGFGVGEVTALAALGLQTHQAQSSLRTQKRGLAFQEDAQQRARAAASSERIRAQTDINKADRKKPDISALLASARGERGLGVNSTFLTGSGGLGQLGGIG